MFIQTEETPNPNALKFIPGVSVLGRNETIYYQNQESAANSYLAEKIMSFNFVKSVMLGNDFITVTKVDEILWDSIKPDILVAIMEFFISGRPVLKKEITDSKADVNVDETEIVKQIRELIETRVRPAVAQDGGDIVFVDFKDGIVYVELQGSCSGCPSSKVTLKEGIERMLKHYVPEIEAVMDYDEGYHQ